MDESFTRSNCQCNFCQETHRLVVEFDRHIPTTILQRNMKRVIAKIERQAQLQPPPLVRQIGYTKILRDSR